MAIYHLHAEIISRKSGRSSVAASAYRAGEKLHNQLDGITHDYTRKTGVVHSEIILANDAPKEFQDRATLWNAVEQIEKRKDAQTARELNIALPIEFDSQEHIEIMRVYVQENFVDHGMCADLAIHDKCDGNPHAHVMLTTRHVNESGFGGKNRDWNDTELLESWRENWADICNERFKQKGLDIRIDHRTLEAQGIEREPTIHVGLSADRKRENEAIIQRNEMLLPERTAEYIHELKQGYAILDKESATLKQNGKQDEANAVNAEKEEFKREYQRQRLLAEIRADWQNIFNRLKELAKEASAKIQSVREDLARRRSEKMLDTITERNFKEIVKELRPKQAKAIAAHREQTKEQKMEIELELF